MKTWIMVRKEDLAIMGSYLSEEKDDTSANRSWLLAEPVCVHIELSEGLVADEVKAELIDDEYILSQDSNKVATKLANKWAIFRMQRDQKLKDSDFTQLSDAPFTVEQKAAWAAYRQDLRDLPEETIDPENPSWPVQPE